MLYVVGGKGQVKPLDSQSARKLKRVQAKKLVKSNKSKKIRGIAFLAVVNFFQVQKFIFGQFLKLQKMEFGLKNYS